METKTQAAILIRVRVDKLIAMLNGNCFAFILLIVYIYLYHVDYNLKEQTLRNNKRKHLIQIIAHKSYSIRDVE